MSKKLVIVFEGIEGSGKSLHSAYLSEYFKRKRISHIKLREPGGSKNSEKIRNLILNNKSNFNKDTDLLLYLAARSENINNLKKFYKKKVIIIDRFTDSTLAYQHYGLGVNLKLINQINKYILKNFKVDFTFLNIVNKKNMLSRLNKRKNLNRYDKFDYNFYSKVQKGFIRLANKNKNKYKIIDSNDDIKLNKAIILEKINKLLK
jgi:dTMP kinase